jgi:hypothetical protein
MICPVDGKWKRIRQQGAHSKPPPRAMPCIKFANCCRDDNATGSCQLCAFSCYLVETDEGNLITRISKAERKLPWQVHPTGMADRLFLLQQTYILDILEQPTPPLVFGKIATHKHLPDCSSTSTGSGNWDHGGRRSYEKI